LELGERGNVGDALAQRRLGSRNAADFPQARLRLGEQQRPLGCGQAQHGRGARGHDYGESQPGHRARSITARSMIGNDKFWRRAQASSPGSIAKVDEQKAQSTRMKPSSPTIASRSSAGKRAITDRT